MNKKCCDSCGASEFLISGHNELECEYCGTRYEVKGVSDSSNYGFSSAGTACAYIMPYSASTMTYPDTTGQYDAVYDDEGDWWQYEDEKKKSPIKRLFGKIIGVNI